MALSEEEIDRVEAEKKELASRASDLQSQVNDGNNIIALKAQQIKALEAQLKQMSATATTTTTSATAKRPQKPSSAP